MKKQVSFVSPFKSEKCIDRDKSVKVFIIRNGAVKTGISLSMEVTKAVFIIMFYDCMIIIIVTGVLQSECGIFPSTTYNGRLPLMVEYLTEASGLSNLIKDAS